MDLRGRKGARLYNIKSIKMETNIVRIPLDEVLKENLPPRVRYQLENNPHRDGENHFAKTLAYVDGVEAGWTFGYPTKLKMGESVVSVGTGTSFFVKEEYRKELLGLSIPEYGVKHARNGIVVGAGYSKAAQPIFRKYLKYAYFPLPRYIYLLHSRSVLEKKLKGILTSLIAPFCDLILGIIHGIHGIHNKIRYAGLTIKEVYDDKAINEVAGIINNDRHQYQELHNAEWLKWALHAYHDDSRYGQHLYTVEQQGKVVAFWMSKIRFYEDLHGEYKKLTLGYIMEWGSTDNSRLAESDICAMAIHSFPKYVDGVVLASPNKHFIDKIPFIRRAMGETNFMIYIRKDIREQYPGYKNIDNWRLRPGICDTFFD